MLEPSQAEHLIDITSVRSEHRLEGSIDSRENENENRAIQGSSNLWKEGGVYVNRDISAVSKDSKAGMEDGETEELLTIY